MNQTILCIAFIVMSSSYVRAQLNWDISSPFTNRYYPRDGRPELVYGVSTSYYSGLAELRDNRAVVTYNRSHWKLGFGFGQHGYRISNVSRADISVVRRLNHRFRLGLMFGGFRRYVEQHQNSQWLRLGLVGSYHSMRDTFALQIHRSSEILVLPYSTQFVWIHQLNQLTHVVSTLSTNQESRVTIALQRIIGQHIRLSFLSGFNPLRLGISIIWRLNKTSVACMAHWNQYLGIQNSVVAWRTKSLR